VHGLAADFARGLMTAAHALQKLLYLFISITYIVKSVEFHKCLNLSKFTLETSPFGHYWKVQNETEQFRRQSFHNYAGYSGPWIENYFIKYFITKSPQYWSGAIPLFIQWTDIAVNSPDLLLKLESKLQKILLPTYIYVALSQHDLGLGNITRRHPNIFSISAGGFGHMVIPLIKGEIDYVEPPKSEHLFDFSFFGTNTFFKRGHIMEVLKFAMSDLHVSRFHIGPHKEWVNGISNSKFSFAPRGFGRSSFRLAEIIQIGRIPIYIYDDIAWAPYTNSNSSVANIGYQVHVDEVSALIKKLKNVSINEVVVRNQRIREARPMYTYEGVLQQLEFFFSGQKCSLSCHTLPLKMQ
jgi:hypothetical protein